MNGRKAKEFRRIAYGDMSLRDKRYFWSNGVGSPIIRDTLRRAYQTMKKLYRPGVRDQVSGASVGEKL